MVIVGARTSFSPSIAEVKHLQIYQLHDVLSQNRSPARSCVNVDKSCRSKLQTAIHFVRQKVYFVFELGLSSVVSRLEL